MVEMIRRLVRLGRGARPPLTEEQQAKVEASRLELNEKLVGICRVITGYAMVAL